MAAPFWELVERKLLVQIDTSKSKSRSKSRSPIPAQKKSLLREERSRSKSRTPDESRRERRRKSKSRSKSRTPNETRRERRRNESRGKSRTPDEPRRERRRTSNSRSKSRTPADQSRRDRRSKSRTPGHTRRKIRESSHGKYGSGSPRHQRKEQTKSPLHERTPRRSPSRKETPTPRQYLGSMRHMHSPSRNGIESRNQTQAALLLPDELILEQNGIDMKSLSLQAAEELSKRPKNGEIYNQVEANVKSIEKRLKYLTENFETFSIDMAMEIADAAYLLRLLRKPNLEIEMAGKMAHRGALLILQADMLSNKGHELLEQSKLKLKTTINDECTLIN